MFCTSCGTQATEGGHFCTQCGAPAVAAGSAGAGRPTVSLQKGPQVVSSAADDIPDGVKGWSWGAFLLNWIWAIGNRTYIGLLALIPYVGIVAAFWLGFKGREMAWKNREWESVEHFNRVQRKWSNWGVGLLVVPMAIGILAAIAIPEYKKYVDRAHEKQMESAADDTPSLQAQAPEPAPAPAAQADNAKSGEIDSNSDAAPSRLVTVAGTLERVENADTGSYMTLDGARLFTGDDSPWQFPVRMFQLSDGTQAILMASSGGRGNSCETLFFFLVAAKDGLRPTPEFGTCAPQGSFRQQGDAISIRLPKMGGHSSFKFVDGIVTEDGKPVMLEDSNDPAH